MEGRKTQRRKRKMKERKGKIRIRNSTRLQELRSSIFELSRFNFKNLPY